MISLNQLAELKAFVRYAVGEGIEKREDNFAEEVMNQVKGKLNRLNKNKE